MKDKMVAAKADFRELLKVCIMNHFERTDLEAYISYWSAGK